MVCVDVDSGTGTEEETGGGDLTNKVALAGGEKDQMRQQANQD